MFLFLLIFITSNTYPFPSKYNTAVSTSRDAAYKQSGTEADFLKIQNAGQDNANKWIRSNGLQPVAAVGGAVVPVLLYKKVRAKEGNFILEGVKNKAILTWTIRW